MRGLAPADTMTGRLQRALTDQWQQAGTVIAKADLDTHKDRRTVLACLHRLEVEGRAEFRTNGFWTEWRNVG